MTKTELLELIDNLEIRPVSGSSLSDLDRRRLRDYFARVRNQGVPQDADLEAWQTLLVNTEIMVQEGDRACATVAGLLLFGSAPNRFLPQAGIDAVAYPGREKDYAAKERVALRAPIVSLFQVGCRAARNQLLKDVMRDYNYLEHTGMGVPRKIIKGMLDHNGTQPDLFEEEERFIVRLWK